MNSSNYELNSEMSDEYPNQLVRNVFGNLCIDKRRFNSSGLKNAGVPSFVAEWLIDKIVQGDAELNVGDIEKINNFVSKAFPRKDDRHVLNFKLTQGEILKIIALMQVRVRLENKGDRIPEPVATIPSLNIEECRIGVDLVERYENLLRQGLWGKISLSMQSDGIVEVIDFDPFQCSDINLTEYAKARSQFNTNQWRDLMFCSMGFNPENAGYSTNAKTWVLARLLPLVESNYHIMELAPKGTGKSFIFENISNKVSLISGGKVTPARLFINGKNKEIGLLGRHDVVVLDEVQSLSFDNPEELIGTLKNYLASGRYNRAGFGEVASDCSLVMLANIDLDRQLRPRNPFDLLQDLPEFLRETALLDRFAGILPGWEIPKFRSEAIATQIGLKTDFFGEALLALRRDNRFASYVNQHTSFDRNTTIRDQQAIQRSASGFLKILYPHLELTPMDYQRDCLEPAIRLRQIVRDQLYHLDDEFKQNGTTIYAEAK